MARTRKALRPTDRFEVFKRDGFRCQYCGGTPPSAVLVVDHIRPVADGGTNDPINLVTSCQTCNQGKAAKRLHDLPESVNEAVVTEAERVKQLVEFEKLRKKRERIIAGWVKECADHWRALHGTDFTDRGLATVRMFCGRIGVEQVKEAITAAAKSRYDAYRYFCGVCWRKVKVKEGLCNG